MNRRKKDNKKRYLISYKGHNKFEEEITWGNYFIRYGDLNMVQIHDMVLENARESNNDVEYVQITSISQY